MPSRLHEDLLRLFQNRPALAAELAREVLRARLPGYSRAHLDSANLSDLRPVEYQADLVVLLEQQDVVHGIIVEIQLHQDADKPFTWPAYVCNLRNRKTDFAKRYYGQGLIEGQAKGKAEGRAELVLRLLSLRFGAIPADAQVKIRGATIEELDRIGERLLTAGTLDETLAAP